MEPPTLEIAAIYDHVDFIDTSDPARWAFVLQRLRARFWFTVSDHPTLAPGDRVKISIQKEPQDDPSHQDS